MRKAVIVTSSALSESIKQYEGYKVLFLNSALDIANKTEIKYEVFNKKETENTFAVDATLAKPIEQIDEEKALDDAINYLVDRGYDEITILKSVHTNVFSLMNIVWKFLKYPDMQIEVIDDKESITYFGEGNYIISKGNTKSFSIFGLANAVISLNHTNKKIANEKLVGATNLISNLSFNERVAVLKVEKGAIILIRELN